MENFGGLLGGNLSINYDPILANNDWATIARVAETGKAQDYWNIGDKINIQVGDELLEFAIMDFNLDDKSDGSGKAGITFGMTGLMANTHSMNTTSTNVGSFVGSKMYAYLRDTVLPSIPQELQSIIKPVDKLTSAGNESTEVQTDSMQIWLFSAVEVGLSASYVSSGEGTAYPYYNNGTRTKGSVWWLRSPYLSNPNYFACVFADGNLSSGNPFLATGVSFGFCV